MNTALAPVPPRCVHIPMYAGSYRVLERRVHTLGLASAQLETCRTIADVQALAKPHYRHLIKHYHPDHRAERRLGGKRLNGYTFRLIQNTYDWLMALPDGLLAPWSGRPPPPCAVLEREEQVCPVFGWHIEYH